MGLDGFLQIGAGRRVGGIPLQCAAVALLCFKKLPLYLVQNTQQVMRFREFIV